MQFVIDCIVMLVKAMLSVIDLALFIRAIMSWIMPENDGRFAQIIYSLTEPVIYPFRKFAMRFEIFRTMPIDMGFLFAVIAVTAIRALLPSVRI